MSHLNRYVGLTFDDGPHPATTAALLDALGAVGARATLFNIGARAQRNPALVRAQLDAGMWIGNHSWTHPELPQLSRTQIGDELRRTQRTLHHLTGRAPELFRPPFGQTDTQVRAAQAQQGLTEVLWTVDSQDWNGATTGQIIEAAATLRPGGIILMHDGFQSTIDAVEPIVAALAARGLEPGMISPETGRVVAPS